jgi:glyoxylase-like metal-dependent hydrolase (beta-lactamase superfamily II)
MPLEVETIVNGPFQENCFMVWDDQVGQGIFIDPGDEPSRIARSATFKELEILGIFNTHGHLDHAGGVAELKQQLEIPFAIHPEDAFLLENMPGQARMFGLPPMEVPSIDRELEPGDTIRVGEFEARVLHTPGHTPGGVCFLFESEKMVFVGDTLFAGSIGRTDLPGGSFKQLMESIKTQLMTLDDEFDVLTGHGPPTTIGTERKYNPFVTGEFRGY